MLIELAVGDAFGVGFEYSPINLPLLHKMGLNLKYVKHPKYDTGNGNYSDDSQQSIAIAEHLVLGRSINRVDFAQSFLNAYKRDPRDGYSNRVQQALNTAKSGEELVRLLTRGKSQGNGACMRSSPIGFMKDEDTVLHAAAEQALATHDSVDGVESAQAIALAAYGLRKGISRFDLIEYLAGRWIRVERRGTDGMGSYTVWVALQILKSGKTLTELLRNAVAYPGEGSRGSDSDTVAAIVGALASQCKDVRQTLPKALLNGLESGTYGTSYLRALDTRLIKLSGPQTALF